jgi:acyl carrier protein
MQEPTFDRVKRIIVDELSVKADDVVLDAAIQDDLGCDSLDAVELAMAIEDEFHIEVPDETVPSLKTVGDIVSFIDQALAAKEGVKA